MEITKQLQTYIDNKIIPKGKYFKGSSSGDGSNCLIHSIAQGVGINTTKEERRNIRATLNVGRGALPNDRKITDIILKKLDKPKTSIYYYSEPHKVMDSFTGWHSEAKRLVLVYYTPGHFSPILLS